MKIVRLIILDINVVSELMRPYPDPAVMSWFANRTSTVFYVSAITQAEIMLGISLLPDGKRRETLAEAAEDMFAQDFSSRCLPFDAACTANYAAIVSRQRITGIAISTEDAMISAIALTNGYPLATRNTKDFQIDGLNLIDPWEV
jgi:predicted nucleic acid-binding protein